jgi:hypothetical protein
MTNEEVVRHAILRKLLRLGYIGGKHTSLENVPKGFPRSERKNVLKVAQKMIKEGYFLVTPKPDSLHVSLEPSLLPRIRQEIESEKQ